MSLLSSRALLSPRERRPSCQALLRPLFALTLILLPTLVLAADPFGDFRGLWISRYEYNENSASSITSRINNAADMGITDVIWQVRGRADAYYNSNYEPRAQSLTSSIDPLQIALAAAHARGVKLHAWINTTQVWQGTSQPNDPTHIFHNTNPSFRVTDINGNIEEIVGGQSTHTGRSYAKVNHTLPEVQTHLNNVAQDLATNYDVDGVHLDFIRWLGPGGGSSEGFRPDWDFLPHDTYTHQLYQNARAKMGQTDQRSPNAKRTVIEYKTG